MTETAIDPATTSPEDEGTPAAPASPDQPGTGQPDPVAQARKRQAGAEAARQAAEGKLAEAERELAKYRAEHQTAAEKDLTEVARLTAQLEAAESRAAEAEAKATARVLDAKYPNARKELPEVTDEVRLAKFEALLAEDDDAEEAPTPRGVNPGKSGQKAPAKPPTIADVEAALQAMPLPWARPTA